MRSLRGQLTALVAGLALLAVAVVTVIVATTTNQAFEDLLTEQREAREAILAELNSAALTIGDWDEAAEYLEELAEEYGARIALTDIDGFLLLDTGEGEIPPLEGVVDPFGPLAEFTGEFPYDEELFDATLLACLDREDIAYAFEDEEGWYLVDEEALSSEQTAAVDECFEDAFAEVEENPNWIEEPALVFLSFDASPEIPWVPIALVAAVAIAAAATVAAPLSGLITRSLRSVATAARSIRGGDLSARADVSSPTEVEDLATSFNAMADALSIAEVQREQFTADIAHELRSPLTNIVAHLDAIEDGVIDASPEHIAILTSEASRLAHLVDDLQTLAALDEHSLRLNVAPTDLGPVIEMALAARAARAADAEVMLVRRGGDATLPADGDRIGQILGNLLDNALEHTPRNGMITVSLNAGQHVELSVVDTGPGIDPELLPRVFDRLSRADQARSPGRGGRGLGLAIARGLARAHGGDLTAANEPTGGARFTLALPHEGPE